VLILMAVDLPPGLKEAILELAFRDDQEDDRDLVSLIRERSKDDKAVVRKASLQVGPSHL
jgi:hypothetical protein